MTDEGPLRTSICQAHLVVPEKASAMRFYIGGNMKRSRIAIILLILAVCGVGAIIVLSHRSIPKKYTGSPEKVTIGTVPVDTSALIWIAAELGYFPENGLNVEIKAFDAGKYTVNALLDGEIDVATASEYIVVENAMKEAKLQTIGSIAKQELIYLIGRKDMGIEKVSDLKGKRIGLPRQTSAEFYLGRLLQLHGINFDDVTLVDLNPTQAEESLIKQDVDAVVNWNPYAYRIEKSLGRDVVIWPAQSGQMMYWLLVARPEYVAGHHELIDRLLSSFNQAELFAVNNPDETKRILQRRLHTEEAFVERLWSNIRLGLSLDQGLIIAMEDESRWMIDSNLTSSRKMPYYPDYIYWRGLKKVKPSSVTVIH
jgi:ABC-type nitrate/sulfonate/bicarbonate transport system substrate-binding protein